MGEYNFQTVEDIINYVMPKVDYYRRFPSYKQEVAKELEVIFNIDSEFLFTVVKNNKFVASFTQRIGRMQALKKYCTLLITNIISMWISEKQKKTASRKAIMCARKVRFIKGNVWKNNIRKKYGYTKSCVALRRVSTFYEKNLLGLGVFLSLIYVIIASYIVIYLEMGHMVNPLSAWNDLCSWYKVYCRDTTGYIPTLVVASASLLLTVVTMAQSHYSRAQDRAMEFPQNYVDTVSLGLNVENNLIIAKKYLDDPIEANSLIQFSFMEGFSTYYKAYPYRLFVCLTNQQKKEYKWEELRIDKFRCANLYGQDSGSYKMLIEGSCSKLLIEYYKIQHNRNYSLRMILDVRWTNKLVPIWYRNFSDLYIREEIKIDSSTEGPPGKKAKISSFSSVNKVIFTEHGNSPLAALRLKRKCKATLRNLKKERKHARQNVKNLEEREREKI